MRACSESRGGTYYLESSRELLVTRRRPMLATARRLRLRHPVMTSIRCQRQRGAARLMTPRRLRANERNAFAYPVDALVPLELFRIGLMGKKRKG